MRLTFNFDQLTIKYVDEDNDEVTITSEQELREAFKVSHYLLQANLESGYEFKEIPCFDESTILRWNLRFFKI